MSLTDIFDTFTIVACSIIVSAFLGAWIYIARTNSSEFPKRKKWIDQLPSVISTLGVLGTFVGITRGLIAFNTLDLDKSIPLLLDGLKTAFFTSLLGMFGSLILNRVVSHKFDKEEKESEVMKAAKFIVEAMNTNHRNIPAILDNRNKELLNVMLNNDMTRGLKADIEQIKDDVEEIKGHIEDMNSKNTQVLSILNSINSATSSTADELPRIRAVAVTATASISALDNNIGNINSTITSIESSTSDIKDNVESINEKNEEVY